MYQHLYELATARAVQHPTAVTFGSQDHLRWRSSTSVEVLSQVDALAAELADAGVQSGDRIVLWMPGDRRTPVYHFALWKLGAIVVPFDREMNPDAGVRIVESVRPRCIVLGYDERPPWLGRQAALNWWEPGTRGGSATNAGWTPPAEELAAIVFTSGTTGNPKGCMITHANLCSQVDALRQTIALDPNCRLASILPLSHLFELTVGLLYPFSCGAEVHYVPSRRGPDIVRVLSEQRITHMVAVPQLLTVMGQVLEEQLSAKLPATLLAGMARLAPRLPLNARRALYWPVHHRLGGQLRMLASGGAALPPVTQQLWERIGVRVVQGYGASECSPVIACGNEDGSTPLGSVGRPLDGVETRLAADGEMLVRGPNLTRGYWEDPEQTAKVIHDGWYSTGDLATADAAANIMLSGRAKDLIVLPSGMNVWPQDVEDALRAEPGVRDAAVVAVASAAGGATLHGYLLPATPQAKPDIGSIVARANGRLAQHQRLATASWWPEGDFPRTAIGKVRRNLLPQPAVDAISRIASVAASDDPVSQAVAGVARVPSVMPDQTLGELGLDSFGFVELSLAIEEKTARAISDSALFTDMTVSQLRALVESADASVGEPDGGDEHISVTQPLWPYTWGRIFRSLSLPFDVLYRLVVTRTVVLGREHLRHLPRRVIFAGTHHGFADMPLIRFGLEKTAARGYSHRLAVAVAASEFAKAGPLANYGRLAFGLYPLRQRGEREASLRGLARLAEAGNAVLIFPQGLHATPVAERAGDPNVRFRPGVGHLAAALEAAVVPFGVAGTDLLIPPEREVFHGLVIAGVPVSLHRGPLAIAFGEPLTVAPGEQPEAFALRLQQASFALARQAEAAIDGAARP